MSESERQIKDVAVVLKNVGIRSISPTLKNGSPNSV